MRVEVINTGTELLLGNVVNTHISYLGKTLFPLGLRIDRQITVPDGSAIRDALYEAFPRSDILIVTGGLGPTTDDITREIVAELLGLSLKEDPWVIEAIRARLDRRGIPYRARIQRQAMVPMGATVLRNDNGTAPGLYLPSRSTPAWASPHLFLLPGPPRELKPMFEDYALPILRDLIGTASPDRECRLYHIVGIGESGVEELVGLSLTERGDIEVGYCARPNEVDLRLIAPPAILDEVEPLVREVLGSYIVSQSGQSLEEVVVERLLESQQSVAVAESCTGGLLANRITNVPGASEIFPAGYVTYANEAKERELGVPSELLARVGAVSEEVASAMAEGVLRRAGTDFGIGITGIAGPGGGSTEKPVGTVYIALAQKGGVTECLRETFPTDRETFKRLATQAALDLLRRRLG